MFTMWRRMWALISSPSQLRNPKVSHEADSVEYLSTIGEALKNKFGKFHIPSRHPPQPIAQVQEGIYKLSLLFVQFAFGGI